MKDFEELGIKKFASTIKEMGLKEPFPIQEKAIPVLLEGRDLIGQAQTGTGKTAAFGLPILESIDESVHDTQALIIVPTRELAQQVAEEIQKFSKGRIRVTPVYGGESMLKQIRFLKTARQIVVATPGRMLDYIKQEVFSLKKVRFVVLDEADRMLDMGFIIDVKRILSKLPPRRQTSMFSATMPKEIITLSKEFLRNPEKIVVSKDEISNENINQFYIRMDNRDKLNQMCSLLEKGKKTIVFCATKTRVRRLALDLCKRGFEIDAIHGDMEQYQRSRVIRDFKSHKSNILIATDVVSRGIDVPFVDRVISFDVPKDTMSYFHRIGRTARAGKKGTAILFVTNDDRKAFSDIRNHTKMPINMIRKENVDDFAIVKKVDENRFGRMSRFGGSGRRFEFKRKFDPNGPPQSKRFHSSPPHSDRQGMGRKGAGQSKGRSKRNFRK